MRQSLIMLASIALLPGGLCAQAPTDREAVQHAASDYLDAFYLGDSTAIVRSIRPEVVKYGFYIPDDGQPYQGSAMSYAQMFEYARDVRTTGQGGPPPDAVREVVVLDVLDQIAVAKVTAWWGVDYLHLAKYDSRWMIRHVIWQTPPGP